MRQKYIYVAVTVVVIALSASLMIALNGKRSMETKWRNAVENVKAYGSQFEYSESRNRAFKLTIDQLRHSNDSIFGELNKVRKELGIKDSKLKGLQYVSSSFSKTDTIILTDTLFHNPKMYVDTVLSDEWYSIRVALRYPSMVAVKPEFISKKYIVVSSKRETVNPPKKFFLFRLFQKKHTIVNIDVVEKNPYIQNQSNRFVEIVR